MRDALGDVSQERLGRMAEALQASGITAEALTDFMKVAVALSVGRLDVGDCREAEPYSPLKPILENGELRWCCTHSPERHCAAVVARTKQ